MLKEKLNSLVESYQESRNDVIFGEIYEAVSARFDKSRYYDAKKTGSTEDEVQALYDDVLCETIGKFDAGKGNFENLLFRAVSLRKVDLFRTKKRRSKYEYLPRESQGSDEDDGTLSIFDLQEVQSNIEIEQQKKDQRQLVKYLYVNTDDFGKLVISEMLELGTDRPYVIAKSLGTYPHKVKSALSKIKNQYDANRFGLINDYLSA